MSIPTTPPSGFRDFSPRDCALRAKAIETISRVYRGFGFSQVATSAVEDLAVLTGKGGGENEKLIFKILKRGDKLEEAKAGGELADLGLRFDLTLPLARYYSKYGSQLPHPFKAFHIGPVWRAERAQKGRYREFYQCDADIIGTDSVDAEVEVITAILTVFKEFGLERVRVHINDRRIVDQALAAAKVPADKRMGACVIIDKLDKMEYIKVCAELADEVGKESTDELTKTIMAMKPSHEFMSQIGPEEFKNLLNIREGVKAANPEIAVEITPNLMRGLGYYTGPVFEFRHQNLSGSLGGGGRYDRLTETFGGPKVPACGASIGFERLLLLLAEMPPAAMKAGARVCVTVFEDSLREKTLAMAAELRARRISGLIVDVYPGAGKLKAQFKYADTTGADLALVMGPDEVAKGLIQRKDMKTGEETAVSFEDLAASLSA
ncbi:MAG: histidine--tRNA ligase [Elusimicrobia bacterium]|nr:histidine--tRNA ligase [Elusimicrobiota bacterium]